MPVALLCHQQHFNARFTPTHSWLQEAELEALFEAEEAPGDATNAAPKYRLKVLDSLPGLGPIRSLMVSPPPPRLAGEALGASQCVDDNSGNGTWSIWGCWAWAPSAA